MSSSKCCFLACIQISQEAGKVICYSHLFQNFPQFVVIHTVKGFGIVSEAEVDFFFKFSCFFYYPMDVGSLIFGSSAFSKSSLNIWKFSVHVHRLLIFFFGHMTYGIFPDQGLNLCPLALGSLRHWTIREVPCNRLWCHVCWMNEVGKVSKRTKDGRESRLDINNSKYTIKELRVFTHE